MKIKTSITLTRRTVREIDELAESHANRSRVIKQAVLEFIKCCRRRVRDERDPEILNRAADELNREVEDILTYRIEP